MNYKLFFCLLLFASACTRPTPLALPLNSDYQWEVELTTDWQALNEKQAAELKQRGDKVLRGKRNIDTNGFTDILNLENGKSKLMSAVGTHQVNLHGAYESSRAQRIKFTLNQFQAAEMTAKTSIDSTDLTLGSLSLKKYTLRIDFDKLPVLGTTPQIFVSYYEGLINEKNFLLIYAQSHQLEIIEELHQIVESSQIIPL